MVRHHLEYDVKYLAIKCFSVRVDRIWVVQTKCNLVQ